MAEGAPLARRIPGRARLGRRRLVVQGGLRILDKLASKPFRRLAATARTIGASDAPLLLWRAMTMPANRTNTRREGRRDEHKTDKTSDPTTAGASTRGQYVQQKAAASGSSFYYAFLLLPPPPRRRSPPSTRSAARSTMWSMRCTDPGVAATKLAWWRKEASSAFNGQPLASGDEGADAARQGLRHPAASSTCAVIDGCQMDLEQTRYLDYPGLQRYCHLVAGRGGRGCGIGIFGRTDPQTIAYAHKLGLAMQLTNIIRDVGDDARRGRIYLPVSELQQFDVKAHEILKRDAPWGYSDRFTALMKFQAEPRACAVRRGGGAAVRYRPQGAEAGAHDGQHLPHAAARDRGARTSRSCTSASR